MLLVRTPSRRKLTSEGSFSETVDRTMVPPILPPEVVEGATTKTEDETKPPTDENKKEVDADAVDNNNGDDVNSENSSSNRTGSFLKKRFGDAKNAASLNVDTGGSVFSASSSPHTGRSDNNRSTFSPVDRLSATPFRPSSAKSSATRKSSISSATSAGGKKSVVSRGEGGEEEDIGSVSSRSSSDNSSTSSSGSSSDSDDPDAMQVVLSGETISDFPAHGRRASEVQQQNNGENKLANSIENSQQFRSSQGTLPPVASTPGAKIAAGLWSASPGAATGLESSGGIHPSHHGAGPASSVAAHSLIREDLSSSPVFNDPLHQEMNTDRKVEWMRQCPMIADADPIRQEVLAYFSSVRTMLQGELLYSFGDTAEKVYMIVRGSASADEYDDHYGPLPMPTPTGAAMSKNRMLGGSAAFGRSSPAKGPISSPSKTILLKNSSALPTVTPKTGRNPRLRGSPSPSNGKSPARRGYLSASSPSLDEAPLVAAGIVIGPGGFLGAIPAVGVTRFGFERHTVTIQERTVLLCWEAADFLGQLTEEQLRELQQLSPFLKQRSRRSTRTPTSRRITMSGTPDPSPRSQTPTREPPEFLRSKTLSAMDFTAQIIVKEKKLEEQQKQLLLIQQQIQEEQIAMLQKERRKSRLSSAGGGGSGVASRRASELLQQEQQQNNTVDATKLASTSSFFMDDEPGPGLITPGDLEGAMLKPSPSAALNSSSKIPAAFEKDGSALDLSMSGAVIVSSNSHGEKIVSQRKGDGTLDMSSNSRINISSVSNNNNSNNFRDESNDNLMLLSDELDARRVLEEDGMEPYYSDDDEHVWTLDEEQFGFNDNAFRQARKQGESGAFSYTAKLEKAEGEDEENGRSAWRVGGTGGMKGTPLMNRAKMMMRSRWLSGTRTHSELTNAFRAATAEIDREVPVVTTGPKKRVSGPTSDLIMLKMTFRLEDAHSKEASIKKPAPFTPEDGTAAAAAARSRSPSPSPSVSPSMRASSPAKDAPNASFRSPTRLAADSNEKRLEMSRMQDLDNMIGTCTKKEKEQILSSPILKPVRVNEIERNLAKSRSKPLLPHETVMAGKLKGIGIYRGDIECEEIAEDALIAAEHRELELLRKQREAEAVMDRRRGGVLLDGQVSHSLSSIGVNHFSYSNAENPLGGASRTNSNSSTIVAAARNTKDKPVSNSPHANEKSPHKSGANSVLNESSASHAHGLADSPGSKKINIKSRDYKPWREPPKQPPREERWTAPLLLSATYGHCPRLMGPQAAGKDDAKSGNATLVNLLKSTLDDATLPLFGRYTANYLRVVMHNAAELAKDSRGRIHKNRQRQSITEQMGGQDGELSMMFSKVNKSRRPLTTPRSDPINWNDYED